MREYISGYARVYVIVYSVICALYQILPKARVMREAYICIYVHTRTRTLYIHVYTILYVLLEYVRARFTSPARRPITEYACAAIFRVPCARALYVK